MKRNKWIAALSALVLTGTLAWAEVGWSQPQGESAQSDAQQSVRRGQGPGNPDCPNYPGYRNCPQGQGQGQGNPQCPWGTGKGRGSRGRGRNAPGNQGAGQPSPTN